MRDRILRYLYDHPQGNAGSIAVRFGTTRGTINHILYGEIYQDKLATYDYFHRWSLTAKGITQVERAIERENQWPQEDDDRLRQMIHDYWDIDRVVKTLGRDISAVEKEMARLGIEYAQEPPTQTEPEQAPEKPQQIEPIDDTDSDKPQLSELQLQLAEKLLSLIPEKEGISLTTLVIKHELDREQLLPVLNILCQQDVLRYDKMNRLWFVQDRKKIQESLAEPEEQTVIEPEPEEPKEPTTEQLHDIVAASIDTLNLCARFGERQYLAARYRITRNGQNDAYWLATTERVLNADHDVRHQLGAHIAYKNSLMGVCLQTTEEGKDFAYNAPAGHMENHVHNMHVIHTREIRIENDSKPYNYRQYESLDAFMRLLHQKQQEIEQKVAEIEQKELQRQNEDLTPIEKGQLTREINKMKEEKRQLAGQRDDLLLLSNYIREQGKLRYNPILDKKQAQIKTNFLYDGTALVIDGGPGTGKTTTMIQRLKYLTDVKAIEEDFTDGYNRFHLTRDQRENLLKRIENNHDWIFFSPSQLLKSYLADAMNREGLADTNSKVWDWSEFRKSALRAYGFFGIGKSFPFIDCPETDVLIYSDTAPRKQFIDFLKESICKEVAQLPTIESTHIAGMSNNARRIVAELDGIESDSLQGIVRRLFRMQQIQLDKTVEIESELGQLASILESEILKDNDLVELLSEIQLQDEDIEYEKAEKDEHSDLWFLLKNWLHAYCYDRLYPSEEHSAEYKDILDLLNDIVKKIEIARLNRIGDGLIYERYSNFTKGVNKIIFQRIPKYFKAFRQYIIERNNTEEWNVDLLKSIIKKNKKQLHFQEQALLLLITNDLIITANKALPNHTIRHKYIDAYDELVRPIIGIDEVTDFSEVEILSIISFALQDYNSITMAGDLMQRLTVGGIKSWDALDNAVLNKEVVELRTSYRQSKRMLEVAQQLYEDTIGDSPNYKAHMQENKVPRPLMYVSDSENKKIQWIENRIAEVYQAYSNQMPATAIFLNSKEEVTPFVEKMRESSVLQGAGIEIVDGTDGNVLGSRQQIRVYPINVVKGLEFDVVFFHNIDSAGFDNDTIKRYIYVGVSRAAFFLGATLTRDIPAISQYFSRKKNWRNFTDDESNS